MAYKEETRKEYKGTSTRRGLELKVFFDKLKSARNNHEMDWEDLQRYLRPSSQGFITKNADGLVNRNFIHDSTPERSSEDLSSAMLSMLASPGIDWFGLKQGGGKKPSTAVKKHLSEAKSMIKEHLSLRVSNCYNALGSTFDDMVVFGQGGMSRHRDIEKKVVRFAPIPLSEVYHQRNEYGEVDACYRKYLYTPRQMRQAFCEAPGTELTKAHKAELEQMEKNSPEQEITVIHCVFPREERNINSPLPQDKKYASIYLWYDKGVVLKESGFDYFPYMFPVWKLLAGESYGRGPGHRALPDIKTLNEMVKTNIAASQVILTPPMAVPWGLMLDETIDLSPLAVNYTNISNASFGTQQTKPEPLNIIKDLPVGIEMEDRRKAGIQMSFYSDLLQELKNAEMSATESTQRDQARIRRLTGPFTRIEQEALAPIVEFTYESLIEFKLLEQPPELKDEKVEIYFTTALADAYKAAKIQVLERALGSLAQMQGIPPQVMNGIVAEELPLFVFDNLGADLSLLRDPKEAKQMTKDQQASVADQQDAESLKTAAAGVKSLAEAAQINRGI